MQFPKKGRDVPSFPRVKSLFIKARTKKYTRRSIFVDLCNPTQPPDRMRGCAPHLQDEIAGRQTKPAPYRQFPASAAVCWGAALPLIARPGWISLGRRLFLCTFSLHVDSSAMKKDGVPILFRCLAFLADVRDTMYALQRARFQFADHYIFFVPAQAIRRLNPEFDCRPKSKAPII